MSLLSRIAGTIASSFSFVGNLAQASGMGWAIPHSGQSGVPFAFTSNAPIAIGAGGSFVLSAAQQGNVRTPLTGSLLGPATIVLPNVAGLYFFDVTGLTLSASSLTFQSGSATEVLAALPTNGLIIVVTGGTNTLAVSP